MPKKRRAWRPVSILVLNRQRSRVADRPGMVDFLRALSHELKPAGDFTVVFISDRAMRRYNRDYRGEDKATDVLSFPGDGGYLGDILISTDTAFGQSVESARLTFADAMKRLALHGLLHLMGYDHETDDGEMRALERRLRRRFKC